MDHLLYILLNISLPIIILIALGFGFQKIFKTDAKVLPKLLLYFAGPVMMFVKIYRAEITADFFGKVLAFILLMIVAMLIISLVLARMLRFPKSRRNAQTNAMVFFNTGNYGIPLIDLVFPGNPMTAASQLLMVVVQSATYNTFGVFMASSGHTSGRRALLSVVKMPAIYAIALATLVKVTGVTIPNPIMIPLDYITSAFIAIALTALGMQLATVSFRGSFRAVIISTLVKTVATPLLAFGFIRLLDIKGILAQALIIGISTPTAVTAAILAREFDNEVDYSAQMVLSTTLLCTFTLPLIIWFAQNYF